MLCFGHDHINHINSLLPQLGYQNEFNFSVMDTNVEADEDSDDDEPKDEFYLDPQIIKSMLTKIDHSDVV